MGTPWQHQQRKKGLATDCIGLVGGVALELGVEGAQEWADDPSLHCYGRLPMDLLLSGCDRFLTRIPVAESGLGDVLVMAFRNYPQHVAIVSQLDPMYLIHAYLQVGRVVENGARVAGAKIVRAYRFRGIV